MLDSQYVEPGDNEDDGNEDIGNPGFPEAHRDVGIPLEFLFGIPAWVPVFPRAKYQVSLGGKNPRLVANMAIGRVQRAPIKEGNSGPKNRANAR